MNTMKCVAIDDEPLALEVIERFVAKVPELELVATFTNPLEAVAKMREAEVDLLFLDIHMPDLTGLQLLQSLPKLPLIIFTTAYSQYATNSYDLDAVDYLLKPIPFDRFLKAVNKAFREQKSRSGQDDGSSAEDYLFIKSDTRFFKVDYADILYVEGMRDYVAVHTPKQKILTLMSMTKMMEKLPEDQFMRVHKSYIIAIRHIELIQHHRVTIHGREIPVSNSYREAFQNFVENR